MEAGKEERGKNMLITIIHIVRMGVATEVEGLHFLFVDYFFPLPPLTIGNSFKFCQLLRKFSQIRLM